MTRRAATIAIAIFDIVVSAAIAVGYLKSQSDPATRGFDIAAGYVTSLLSVLTAVPALALVYAGKAPKTALALALAFPAIFVASFIAVALYFDL